MAVKGYHFGGGVNRFSFVVSPSLASLAENANDHYCFNI